jgi:hypothetical protein
MEDEQPIQSEAIPQTLSHLIQLNERYNRHPCEARIPIIFDFRY